jgi:hypothetical protein
MDISGNPHLRLVDNRSIFSGSHDTYPDNTLDIPPLRSLEDSVAPVGMTI